MKIYITRRVLVMDTVYSILGLENITERNWVQRTLKENHNVLVNTVETTDSTCTLHDAQLIPLPFATLYGFTTPHCLLCFSCSPR